MNSTPADADTVPRGTVLVVNKDDQTLALVSGEELRVVETVELSGTTGHEVAAHPSLPLAYVPIYGDAGVGAPGTDGGTIDVVDLVNGKREMTIDLRAPCRPHCAVFGTDGLLYVTTEVNEAITVVDTETQSVVRALNTGHAQSHMLALAPDGTRGYTANVRPGSISEVDLESGRLMRMIEIAEEINRISLAPDGSLAFTADQRQPRLAVVDLASGKIARWVELPSVAFGSAARPDGRALILALRGSAQVACVDLETFDVSALVDVAHSPQMILLDPSGTTAYTASAPAGCLTAFRTSDMMVVATVETGRNPDGLGFSSFSHESGGRAGA